MVGNDIVDLTHHSRMHPRRGRFMAKVFTPNEQKCIASATDWFSSMWVLWAMKETVYKLSVQQGRQKRFLPLDFEGVLKRDTSGVVYVDDHCHTCAVHLTPSYVYCQARSQQAIPYEYKVLESITGGELKSAELYTRTAAAIERKYMFPERSVQLRKNSRQIPQVYVHGRLESIDVSLSHDGKYGAYLFSSTIGSGITSTNEEVPFVLEPLVHCHSSSRIILP